MRAITRKRARCAAAFVASAVVGASLAAHATPQCRSRTELRLEVVSVKVDGAQRPVPSKDKSFSISNVEGGTFGDLYDPDAPETVRQVRLVDR